MSAPDSSTCSFGLRQCWDFYWPLALTALLMVAGQQVIDASCRFADDPDREWATLAIVFGVLAIFRAFLAFLPQVINVLADSPPNLQVCRRFSIVLALALSSGLAVMAYTPAGLAVLRSTYALDPQLVERARDYLALLVFLPLPIALRQFYAGLLIQNERTRRVTVGNFIGIAVLAPVLFGGMGWGFPATRVIPVAMLASECANLLWLLGSRATARLCERADLLTYRAMARFFLPTAVTTIMYAASRPVMYAFVSRQADGEATIAGLRLGFGIAMLFHMPLNQVRHLLVTYGRDQLPVLRRFLTRMVGWDMLVMALFVFSPAAMWTLRTVYRASPAVAERAWWVLAVLCLMPAVITLRNYYHGQLLLRRVTLAMGYGGLARVGLIAAACAAVTTWCSLGAIAAAAILIAGFGIEALIGRWEVARLQRRAARRQFLS